MSEKPPQVSIRTFQPYLMWLIHVHCDQKCALHICAITFNICNVHLCNRDECEGLSPGAVVMLHSSLKPIKSLRGSNGCFLCVFCAGRRLLGVVWPAARWSEANKHIPHQNPTLVWALQTRRSSSVPLTCVCALSLNHNFFSLPRVAHSLFLLTRCPL